MADLRIDTGGIATSPDPLLQNSDNHVYELTMNSHTTRYVAITLFLLMLSVSAGAQQPGVSQPAPVASPQASNNDYVFPTSEQRLKRYSRSMFGPFAVTRVAVSAGINQWDDSPEEWGQGAEGYGKRFASDFGRNAIRQTVTFGLSEALRLDTGFYRSKRKGFGPRLRDALVQNVTSRTRTGKRVISAPILVGAYTAPIIAYETWYPERHSYKDGLRSGSISLATGFAINVVREFLFNW